MSIASQRKLWQAIPNGALLPEGVFCNAIWFTKNEPGNPQSWYTEHRCFREPRHAGRCMCDFDGRTHSMRRVEGGGRKTQEQVTDEGMPGAHQAIETIQGETLEWTYLK